jgi:hypothetical protein
MSHGRDHGLRRDPAWFAGELDVVELRESVAGEDRDGQPRTFHAGTAGTVVHVGGDGDAFYVEVTRPEGPDFPTPGYRGETLGFFWARPPELRVTHRYTDN